MMQKDNRTIAFVCTGNTCRSPMAEAIFNDMAEKNGVCVRAESFGIATSTGLPVRKSELTFRAKLQQPWLMPALKNTKNFTVCRKVTQKC